MVHLGWPCVIVTFVYLLVSATAIQSPFDIVWNNAALGIVCWNPPPTEYLFGTFCAGELRNHPYIPISTDSATDPLRFDLMYTTPDGAAFWSATCLPGYTTVGDFITKGEKPVNVPCIPYSDLTIEAPAVVVPFTTAENKTFTIMPLDFDMFIFDPLHEGKEPEEHLETMRSCYKRGTCDTQHGSSGGTGTCPCDGCYPGWSGAYCTIPDPVCPNNACENGESCTSCPQDCGACLYCGDNACNNGETAGTCPQDCTVCGDAVCTGSESCATCPGDCGVCQYCGDNICNNGENAVTCAHDCTVCGDAMCTGSETCGSCTSDCGACPFCGDNICNNGETVSTCSDCSVCGDLQCTWNENCGTCATDCGACCDPATTCSGHGQCSGSNCNCALNWAGGNCGSCNTNYYGSTCASYCDPTTCSGHGACQGDGSCGCNTNWGGTLCASCVANQYGSDCSITCNAATTCHGNGDCDTNGTCACHTGWTGAQCDTCAAGYYGSDCSKHCVASEECSGNGYCDASGNCHCSPGFSGINCNNCGTNYYGAMCETYCDPTTTCSGHGACNTQGTCACSSPFTGTSCAACLATYYGTNCDTKCDASTTCKGNGACNSSGLCVCAGNFVGSDCGSCATNYYGANCDIYCDAAETCTGHGTCSNGACVCSGNFIGAGCKQCQANYYGTSCDQYCTNATCSNRGTCDATTGACACSGYFTGSACDSCATNYYSSSCGAYCDPAVTCSGQGSCNTMTGLCACSPGYTGSSCNVSTYRPTLPPTLPPGTPTSTPTKSTPTPSPKPTLFPPGCDCKVGDVCCGADCKFLNATTACRSLAGVCDVVEFCTGKSSLCPPDVGKDPSTICRPVLKECDVPAVCGGSKSMCPAAKNITRDTCGVCGGDSTSCTSKGVCGDSLCNALIGENCTTCVLDCGYCMIKDACATVKCAHGRCDDRTGICMCDAAWSGPLCDTTKLEVVPTLLPNGGSGIRLSSLGSALRKRDETTQSVTFSIAITQLAEISTDGSVIAAYPTQTSNLTSTASTRNGTTSFNYSIHLPNNAYVTFSFIQFATPTLVNFANQSFTIAPNTLKSTINIFNWPFASVNHHLKIWTSIQGDSDSGQNCEAVSQQNTDSDNVKWLQLTVNGQAMFASFLENAEIDGTPKPSEIKTDSTSKLITYTVPHFWSYATIDPDYSIFLDLDAPAQAQANCSQLEASNANGKKPLKHSNKIVIAVTVSVVGAAVIAAGIIYFVKRGIERKTLQTLSST